MRISNLKSSLIYENCYQTITMHTTFAVMMMFKAAIAAQLKASAAPIP